MQEVVLSIGPSGAGKTFTQKKYFPDYTLVCPDDIRKKVNKDVSSQDNAWLVWKIAYKSLKKAISNGENVYFSATNCRLKALKDLVKEINEVKSESNEIRITFLVLDAGFDVNLCLKRVRDDIDNNIDRSNTLIIDEKTGTTVVEKQYNNFLNLVNNEFEKEEFKDYCNENNIVIKHI